MNVALTMKIMGWLLLALAGLLLTPLVPSLAFGDGEVLTFLLSAAVAGGGVGGILVSRLRPDPRFSLREAFGVVTFGWIVFALFGALPFLFSGTLTDPVDAFFESMSGFTTTGSTVITRLGDVPESVLFWRALTQWLGGMGIIVLSLAILPFLGVGGMQLFEAEVPGPTADRLRPRIQDTAKLLWGVYFAITLAEVVLLLCGGVNLFEAVCHAFTTMATGGFSTRDASVAAFPSSYVHVVIALFMFLAGTNFSLHYHALRGKPGRYWRSEEFRFYLKLTLASILVVFLFNLARYGATALNARDSAFQVVSLMTTTGYGTADYELWPALSQYVLVTLMFVGGCAGSTGGGMKNARILVLLKHSWLQLSRLIHPKRVRILKLEGSVVPNDIVQAILSFFALYVGIFVAASFVMAAVGLDLVTAGASVIACLSNIGPGLGEVGPTDNFAHVPEVGKVVLGVCMLVGRLEVFTVLVLIVPSFWKK